MYSKVALVAFTALTAFTFHWYPGLAPPLTGVAVTVTGVPAQVVSEVAAIVTEAGSSGLTAMITGSEVAGFPETQAAFEVSTQVTVSVSCGM